MKEVLATLGILIGFCASLDAASFTVTNTADSGAGSLRQAILDAEGTPEGDEISLAGLTGTITLQSVLPTITGEVTISGPGSAALKISGDNRSQILLIDAASNLTLSGLSLADGRAEAYLNGGAIQNRGTLLISDCVFSNNHAYGGFGGAIFNEGTLTVSNSQFTGNHVTGGGSSGSGTGGALGGGGGAFGGAIYTRIGSLELSDSTLTGNHVTGGNGSVPFSADGPASAAATGGGPNGGLPGVQIAGVGQVGGAGGFASGGGGGGRSASQIGGAGGQGGFGGGGGGGGGGLAFFGGSGAAGGLGGFGGGIGATAGSAGASGQPGGGGAGFGGAIFVESGSVTLLRSSVTQNTASGGDGSDSNSSLYGSGGGGGAGMGAGLFLYGGSISLEECTVDANSAIGGLSGYGHLYGGTWS
jgi:hypothetical protein